MLMLSSLIEAYEHVLYRMQTEEQKRGKPGNKATKNHDECLEPLLSCNC